MRGSDTVTVCVGDGFYGVFSCFPPERIRALSRLPEENIEIYALCLSVPAHSLLRIGADLLNISVRCVTCE